MKIVKLLFAATALLAIAGCDDKTATTGGGDGPAVTAAPVPAPNGGDWSTIVKATPEGGYLMGNPDAKVKLVEFASMTCPHCREFEETGAKSLIDDYVKKGLASWEFRNFVMNPYDMTAAMVARCGGEGGFFGLTRNLYASQPEWMAKLQAADPAQMQALSTQPPARQFPAIADLAGLKSFAAMRGVPRARLDQCLADQAGIDKLVQMTADATSQYNVPGTPAFLLNGTLVKDVATWSDLEPKIKEELAS